MEIHLIGGWKGSGKSTAIDKACKILEDRNITSSVLKDISCDIDQLNEQIRKLKNGTMDHLVVFAEYSSLCTNPESTFLKPLRESKGGEIESSDISVFADARLLLPYLRGTEMPLNAEDKKAWEKQISEAEILVITKTDLLSDCQFEAIELFAGDYFPSKQVVLLDPYDKDTVSDWLNIISGPGCIMDKDLSKKIDSKGESARLDEEIEIATADASAAERAYRFMTQLSGDLLHKNIQVEHFHFFLSFNGISSNISYKELSDKNNPAANKTEKASSVNLLIDGRVYISPDELRKILFDRLNELKSFEGITVREKFISLS